MRGGGTKPYRQKGTGNARQGSTRAPHWSGGGVALGPKPRSYAQRTPKKMIRLALRSALSDRAAEGKVVVVDELGLRRPQDPRRQGGARRPRHRRARRSWWSTATTTNAISSFRNLPDVQLIEVGELNAYDVLCNDWIVFTQATLPGATAEEAEASEAAAETEADQ